jgi:hypothetical protein
MPLYACLHYFSLLPAFVHSLLVLILPSIQIPTLVQQQIEDEPTKDEIRCDVVHKKQGKDDDDDDDDEDGDERKSDKESDAIDLKVYQEIKSEVLCRRKRRSWMFLMERLGFDLI